MRSQSGLSLALIAFFSLTSTAAAQRPAEADATIDARTRTQVIDGALKNLDASYVFPDKAREMGQAVRARARRGEYDRITSARTLADSLTSHLQAVTHDKHLRVRYSEKPIVEDGAEGELTAEELRERVSFGRKVNFGLERAERLMGNVGYLHVRSFIFTPEMMDSSLAAAMNFLGNTDALIIDVRDNGGGESTAVALLCSYLLGPGEVLINKFYWRPTDRWEESRTRATVSGRHYGTAKPVYVLTSGGTFSGAEEFAYDIQTQKRGEIVGDTTGGGAHPGGMRRITEHFGVWVPSGRAVNPVTNTNWEGTGVRPDVAVGSGDALRTAHIRALERLIQGATGEDRKQLEGALQRVRTTPSS